MKCPCIPRGHAGFTLVELMVVTALAIIMIGFGYSGFSGLMKRERVSAAATDFAAHLREARAHSIEKGERHMVVVSRNQYTVYTDDDGDCAKATTENTVVQVNVAERFPGVTMTVTGTTFSFFWDSRGVPWVPDTTSGSCVAELMKNSGGFYESESIVFTDGTGTTQTVTVSSLGRIKIESSS